MATLVFLLTQPSPILVPGTCMWKTTRTSDTGTENEGCCSARSSCHHHGLGASFREAQVSPTTKERTFGNGCHCRPLSAQPQNTCPRAKPDTAAGKQLRGSVALPDGPPAASRIACGSHLHPTMPSTSLLAPWVTPKPPRQETRPRPPQRAAVELPSRTNSALALPEHPSPAT